MILVHVVVVRNIKNVVLNRTDPVLSQGDIAQIMESLQNRQLPEPHLHLVKSVVWNGYRCRAIWNTVYLSPLVETFHEFIVGILLSSCGGDWIKSQMSLPEDESHIIRWLKSYEEWRKVNQKGENENDECTWSAIPSGEVMAFHQLAYDIYCLQAVNKLPNFLLKKLKNQNEFQGARYEVAVAAIIARAGFEINFLDANIKSQKHCDFIAKNKYSGEEIGVEAKSRRRKGVLHEKGESKYSELVKGDIRNLFKEARSQKPGNMPYFIFFDLNVSPTPEISSDKKPWLADIESMLDEYGTPSKKNPEPFNALVLTNFSYYYGGNTGTTPPGGYMVITSQFPEYLCSSQQSINEIWESLSRYSHIPKEV